MVSASDVKSLREKTGAGIMDCKKALMETDGDLDKAVDLLREQGIADASKKSARIASEGLVTSYIHGNGKIGVLVEVNCETDFVARNQEFVDLCRDIAMQVAASDPGYIAREEIPEEIIEREKSILRTQALNEGKPEKIVNKIVEGRMEKFYQEQCLMEQPFVKDTDKDIQQLLKENIAKLGENIAIRRFERYVLGEGLEKRECDLADEIKKMTTE
ncbi:MAG: translation elongation factor Ts [Clostridia bacterium]|nr:translation elongation factor Ts [Clostridia bacterium]